MGPLVFALRFRRALLSNSSRCNLTNLALARLAKSGNRLRIFAAIGCAVAAGAASWTPAKYAQSKPKEPVYKKSEVAKHKTLESRVWVTYKDGVYDITDFVEQHPGGAARIMLAAGGAVDPFWGLYRQHMVDDVLEILSQYRIGSLDEADVISGQDISDPYANDPERHPALVVLKDKPFNAATPVELIPDNFITPSSLWYKRHHHPVPVVDEKTFRLEVKADEGVSSVRPLSLSLEDLKKFPKHTVTTTMQCAGNRRSELNALGEPTQGLNWNTGAVSTASWAGAKLRDVLKAAGVNVEDPDLNHVWFIGLDNPYDASIPAKKAIDAFGDVILAYEMNGETLPRDHGYPLRAVVPGHVAARQVKWLHQVVASKVESHSGWQRGVQYKGFSSNIKSFKGIDPSKVTSVQELPVQSAICEPKDDTTISKEEGDIRVRGWAWTGGGRGIVRVEVSNDEGKSWVTANLKKLNQKEGQEWAWTLWEADVPVPEGKNEFQLCARAVDSSYNTQPGEATPLWNLRGILNNSWHKIQIKIEGEP